MVRMTITEIDQYDDEYSENYPLYNVISTVVEDYEGCKGGLRAPEVWRDVLEIEKRLAVKQRPDRFVALERTRLTKEYRRFTFRGSDGKLYFEGNEERSDREVERSVNCVLLTLGMRLGSYPDDMENPYEGIMECIRQMLLKSEDLILLAKLTNEYYDSEDVEEELGNYVPEEDVLRPHVKPMLRGGLQEKYRFLYPIIIYFASALLCEEMVSNDIRESDFYSIWNDLLKNETILTELRKPNEGNMKNTLKDDDLKPENPEYEVLGDKFNLKLVLNIIGVMIDMRVVTGSISGVRKLFFKDNKDRYLSPNKYLKFDEAESAFVDETMYQTVRKIISDHINR